MAIIAIFLGLFMFTLGGSGGSLLLFLVPISAIVILMMRGFRPEDPNGFDYLLPNLAGWIWIIASIFNFLGGLFYFHDFEGLYSFAGLVVGIVIGGQFVRISKRLY